MQVKHAKVLSILAEHVFEAQLIELIERAGASGYSIEEVGRGHGRHGSRAGTLESERLIKIMIVESQQIADAILQGHSSGCRGDELDGATVELTRQGPVKAPP